MPVPEILPEHLAASTYGCIFQSYFLKTALKDCFDKNGQDDIEKWFYALYENKLDHFNSSIADFDKEYYHQLLETDELDEVMKLNPEDYLIDNGNNNFSVDIEKLKMDTKYFLQSHCKTYQILVEKYRQILSED